MINLDLSLLAQSTKIMNWFTPMWILSAGVALGLFLVLLFIGKLVIYSKLPFFNRVAENSTLYAIFGGLTSLLLFGAGLYVLNVLYGSASLWRARPTNNQDAAALLAVVLWLVASAIIGFGFWRLVSRQRIDEVWVYLREGFLSWLAIIATTLTGFAVVGLLLGVFNGFGIIKFVDDPKGMLLSIGRLTTAGIYPQTITLEPTADDSTGQKVDLVYEGAPVTLNTKELKGILFESNQNLQVSAEPITAESGKYIRVPSTSVGRPEYWTQGLPDGDLSFLYFANRGKSPAEVTFAWNIQPIYPEVYLVPMTAVATLGLFVVYLSLMILTPKITAIGLSTFKTEISQPIFIVILILGALFIVGSIYIPYNTLGEDIKMYKDSGLTLLRVLAIFAAIWAASKSVAEEIEGRTALTVLSKPVGRRQFILGKIFGISSALALLFIVLGIWFFFWVAYKPVYDAVEIAAGEIEWNTCFREATHVLPAILLAFLEVVIFVAISVAISTRMGVMGNLMICFAIYVLGHLTALIVMSNDNVIDTVRFFGQFISIVFPVLNHFDVQTAINTNSQVPWIYIGWCTVYSFLYGSAAVLLALVLFEDRDLA